MMKLLVALACIALVAAVPVAQVDKVTEPATKSEEPAPVAAEPATKTEEPSTKAEEPATKAEEPATKTEEPAAKTEEPAAKTEEPAAKTEEPAAKTEEPAAKTEVEEPAKVKADGDDDEKAKVKADGDDDEKAKTKADGDDDEKAKTKADGDDDEKAKVKSVEVSDKEETLKQVVNLMETLTGGMSTKDGKSLTDFMKMGADIMQQAEMKAKDLEQKLDATNLLQSDMLLGVKEDGTIDPTVATDQISNLINIFVGPNTVTTQDKDMMKQVIGTVSTVMTPLLAQMNGDANAPALPDLKTLEPLLKLLMPADAGKDAFNPQALISMVANAVGDAKPAPNTAAAADLATKFLELMEGSDSE